MEKTYNPQDIEQPLYEHWEKQGYFKPNGDESQESFCIMIPPPHDTGIMAEVKAVTDYANVKTQNENKRNPGRNLK